MYGYEITRKIEELSNGKIKLTYGALYPVLHKLESDGEVVTETENVNNRTRIYYSLTKTGDSLASKSIEELAEFIETIGLIVNPKPSPGMNIC
jgi:DNA-binding PadR family transcriptional regulator